MAGPTPQAGGKPGENSSFNAMLAALAPQDAGSAPPVATTAPDPADPSDAGDSGTTDPGEDGATADSELLLALAGAAAQATPPATVARLPAAVARADGARPTRPDAILRANGDAPAAPAVPSNSAVPPQPGAQPSAEVDIGALFPGLAEKLSGAPAPISSPRGKTARAPAATVSGATASATIAPPAGISSPTVGGDTRASDAAAQAETVGSPDAQGQPQAGVPPPTHPGVPSTAATALGDSGTPAAAPADTSVQTQLDVARDGAWLDRLARDIAGAAGQDRTLAFQLNPHHLGALKVEVANGDAGATIRMTAATEAARTLLADQQPRLLAEARAQGMRIADARIDLAGQSGGGQQGFGASTGGQTGQWRQQTASAAWAPLPRAGLSSPVEGVVTRGASGERYA